MTDLADLQLRPTPEMGPPAGEGRRAIALWVGIAALVVGAAAAIYVLFGNRGTDTPPAAATAQAPGKAAVPLAEPAENILLPPLNETDALVRQLVTALSSHPRVAAWLATEDLIRNFTAVTHDISSGHTPRARLQALAPGESFRTLERGGALRIDPASYSRYDSLAGAVASIDAAGAARVYATLKPRMQEAYAEQGFPDTPFDRTLERAIVELLATPILDESIALEPSGARMFAFASPEIESLSSAQKHLLRMGPRNVRIIQDKLREIALAAGIPRDHLPPRRSAAR